MTAGVAISSAAGSGRRGRGRLAAIAVLLAVAALVFLTTRSERVPRFSVESSAPHGYRALALLVQERGATLSATSGDLLDGYDALLVPVPERLSVAELAELDRLAGQGVTVVRAAPGNGDDMFAVPDRTLADLPAAPVAPGRCTLTTLDGLGPIDAAFATEVPVPAGARSCHGSEFGALVVESPAGEGAVVTIGSAYLFSNARLQPNKEAGGAPLDNAAVALRLLAGPDGSHDGLRIGVVESSGTPGAVTSGTRDPIELLPVPVKLALVQGAVALVLYLWWRGRRLGRPVVEPLPVHIAASELVDAIGDLHRRRGSSARAAATMRFDLRRDLSRRLGLPPGAPLDVLVERIAERTGRPVDAVHDALIGPTSPREEDLVRLASSLDSIRQEVLDDPPAR